MSKLYKHIVKEFHISKIQTVVYKHLSNFDTVFDKLKFKMIDECTPNIEVRQSEGLTYEVYNCGRIVYEIDSAEE